MKKQKKPKIASEEAMRDGLLIRARAMKIEKDIQMILDRYDNLIKTCKNKQESYQIRVLGLVELHKALRFPAALIIDGREILPALPDYVPSDKDDPWKI